MLIKKIFLFVAFFGLFITAKAQKITQSKQDSLMTIWNDEAQADTTRLNAVDRIIKEGFQLKSPDSAFYYTQLQYDLAETKGLKKWMAKAKNTQGNSFFKKNDNEKAEEYYLQSIVFAEEIDDKDLIARNSYNIGIGYLKQGNFAKGFPLFSRAAKLFETLGDKKRQALALDKIAYLYTQQSELKKSNEYLTKAVSLREELIKIDSNARDKLTLAGIKQTIKTQELQLIISSDTTKNTEAIKDLQMARDSLGAVGKSLKQNSEQDKTPEIFFNTVSALANKAQVLFKQNDTLKAIPYLEQSLDLAEKEKDLSSTAYVSLMLYKSYRATGQYRKSLEMFERSIVYRDSIINMENAKAVIQLQVESDYDKQKAIDDVENEKEVAVEAAKTKAQSKISLAIGAVLLLISILTFVIFNRLKTTRNQKMIIEEQKKKVEQSEKYKEQFLANMSHEIRTPMHAISGMTKILKRNAHPPTQDAYLNAMHTSSDNLVVILNDVLDLSKIEAGKLEIESIPMNPRLVIENVLQILKFKAEEKGLKLSYKAATDVPALVMGDPTRLNQILINLVGNAIKFTEKGAVDISLHAENEQLQFQIKDTGIGIPKDKQVHIFNAFEQAKNSTTRNYGGTGLGLSISKQLVELQEGNIWLESNEGVGSSFYLALPLRIAKADAVGADLISEEKLKTMAASLEGIRILLAEDNPFNQMIAQDDLSYYIKGITFDIVENGALAVEKFKTDSYDLILMDVQMPELNGFEATKKIREIEKLENREVSIPIIAMTASLMKTEIDSCYRAGMDNYIPKPYAIEELIGPIFKELRTRPRKAS